MRLLAGAMPQVLARPDGRHQLQRADRGERARRRLRRPPGAATQAARQPLQPRGAAAALHGVAVARRAHRPRARQPIRHQGAAAPTSDTPARALQVRWQTKLLMIL
jgi:hypothetical protein